MSDGFVCWFGVVGLKMREGSGLGEVAGMIHSGTKKMWFEALDVFFFGRRALGVCMVGRE